VVVSGLPGDVVLVMLTLEQRTLWKRVQDAALPSYPCDPDGLETVLVLTTDAGSVPMSLADSQRGRAAQTYLANRFLTAGLARSATFRSPDGTPRTDPFRRRWLLPQLVLSHGLARFEGREEVARRILADIMNRDSG